ncbi:MAG: hypothetical protein AB4206_15330 [Xenococcaceae cyanobacterium]
MKKPVTQETLYLILIYAITLTVAKFWDALTHSWLKSHQQERL